MVEAVNIPFVAQLMENGVFKNNETHDKAATVVLDELLRWTDALSLCDSNPFRSAERDVTGRRHARQSLELS
jgi:hypothetical protein